MEKADANPPADPGAGPIRPVALTEQIYAELKRRILTCALKPGERLVEKGLCQDLGVSRTSLREALARLAHEKLVTQVPNRGFSVSPITLEGFEQVCELRAAVESAVAGLAARRASADQVAAMREAATFTPDPGDPEDFAAYCRANRAFHMAVARSVGNPLLEEIVSSGLDKDQQPIAYGIDLAVCTNAAAISAEHHAVVDAVEAGDERRAAELMAAHIGRKEQRLVRAFKEAGLTG